MARRKSVVDIQVNDAKFKEFQSQYNKFLDSLEKMPRGWDKLDKSVGKTSETLRSTTAALLAQQAAFREQDKEASAKQNRALKKARETRAEEARVKRVEREATKKAEKEENDQKKKLLMVERQRKAETKQVLQDTKSIGRAVAKTTVDLFKWVGISEAVVGLAGFGSLWGVADLAGRATDMRRAALSLGTTAPGQEAANIFLSPFMDVNSSLGGIAAAKANMGSWWAQSATGVNFAGMDPVQALLKLLPKAQDYVQTHRLTEQDPYIKAFEAAGISIETLRALQGMSKAELADAIQGTAQGMKSLNEQLDTKNLMAWTKLQVALHNAGVQVEATLIEGLLPLAKSLPDLTVAVTDAIKAFFKTNDVKTIIAQFGKGIKDVAAYISSEDFQKKLGEFSTGLRTLTADIIVLARWVHERLIDLGLIKPDNTYQDQRRQAVAVAGRTMGPIVGAGIGWGMDIAHGNMERFNRPVTGSVAGASRALSRFFTSAGGGGWSAAAAAGIDANIASESGFNPFSTGDHGAAYGLGQWHSDRQKEYLRIFGHTMQSVKNPVQALSEQMRFYSMELQGQTSDRGAAKAGKWLRSPGITAEQAGATVSYFGERPLDQAGEARKRGMLAHQIFVTVNAPPGSQAAVQGAQLSGAQ